MFTDIDLHDKIQYIENALTKYKAIRSCKSIRYGILRFKLNLYNGGKLMERVKYNKVEVRHGDSPKLFPVYEIYLDGVIVTKVSSQVEAEEMVSRWSEIYK